MPALLIGHRSAFVPACRFAWCSEFGVPMNVLPKICSSAEVYGHVFEGPLKGVPIAGVSHAAHLGALRETSA
jgi:glycerol kinase